MFRLGKSAVNVAAAGRRAVSSLPEPKTNPEVLYTGVSVTFNYLTSCFTPLES